MTVGTRIHYMDNLRALAMLAGVVFHAALAHSPLLHSYWPTADTGSSEVVDVVAWFFHLFRMPLFFVVAGFFAALLVGRGGLAGLFHNRLARVGRPLIVFLPLVTISLRLLTLHAAETAGHPSPVLEWIRSHVQENGALPWSFSLAHLWFLWYLLLFTLLTWVGSTLELGRVGPWLAARPAWVIPLALPVLLAPALALVTVPWPAPESFLPALWALVYFGAHFALGYQLFHRPQWLDRLRPGLPAMLFGAVAAYAGLAWLQDAPSDGSVALWRHLIHAVLESYSAFWMTLASLLAGRRWLDGHSPAMRWLADGSYWVYLVHLPVLFAIQYELLDVAMVWPAKFAVSVAGTLAISFLSYAWCIRRTVFGRWLDGRRVTSTPITGAASEEAAGAPKKSHFYLPRNLRR
ncbi:Glucans biosynthesis protein C [Planctomycetes bacterium Poly30]|uniref:Glucans biosynthesis protein C n=1 Tax=Saltatorellus ferox TaxID=2528018 RepID=A0A518ETT9_9BACT|nr:Glucans biosynthesis protein C [Planctomycetes bacterium Poly30]